MEISRLISDMTLIFTFGEELLTEYREEVVNVADVSQALVVCNHEK
jgi:hypothetical protein